MIANDLNDDSFDFLFKIILLGDPGVGKSNILSKFTRNEFNLESKSTIGVEFALRTLQAGNSIIKAQIWDTAGQEKFSSIMSSYFRGAVGAIIVYDITNQESFKSIDRWLKELKNHGEPHQIIMVIGNKTDLQNLRQIPQSEAIEKVKIINSDQNITCLYSETSALDCTSIENALKMIIQEIYSIPQKRNSMVFDKNHGNVRNTYFLKNSFTSGNQSKCCTSF